MRRIEIVRNGVINGTAEFRGIVEHTAGGKTVAPITLTGAPEEFSYTVSPPDCISDEAAEQIAESIGAGQREGKLEDFIWRFE